MKKIGSICGVATLVILFVSDTMTYGQVQSSPPGVDVTGTWQGHWRSGFKRFSGDVSLKLTQQGSAVTGTIKMQSAMNFGEGKKPIRDGQVSSRTFSFIAEGDNSTLNMRLTIQDDRMSAEFTSGSTTIWWHLKKVQ